MIKSLSSRLRWIGPASAAAFHGLLVGFFFQGVIVGLGERGEFFADHVGDFGSHFFCAGGETHENSHRRMLQRRQERTP
jgi:hypothetical protein